MIPSRRIPTTEIQWSVQNRPDADGRIVFRVPEGLQEAGLEAYPFDETIAYKTRLDEHGPLKYWGGGQLGTLDRDRKITIVSYRAPTVLVTVKTDDHLTPKTKLEVARELRLQLE